MAVLPLRRVKNASLTALADAIREKAQIQGRLVFPDEFVEAINNMDSGGDSLDAICLTQTQKSYQNGVDTTVPGYSFYYRPIYHVVLPNATGLGNYCFSRSDLKTLNAPNVTSLGAYCFSNCSNLENFGDLSKVTSVGNYCFIGAEDTEVDNSSVDVNLPNATTLGTYAFQYSKWKSISIPKVTSIQQYSFRRTTTDSIDISGVTSIANNAFEKFQMPGKVLEVPATLNSLGMKAFSYVNCSLIRFEGQVPNIPQMCFQSASTTGFTGRPSYDLSNCTTIPTCYSGSASGSFAGINSTQSIIVPDDLYETWKTTGNWTSWAARIVKKSDYYNS